MARKKHEYYVNNKEFLNLLIENKKITESIKMFSEDPVKNKQSIDLLERKLRKVKNELGTIFLKICKRFLTKPSYIKYSWDRKDIMISDACFYMSNYMDRYKVEKTNPFAYFTQVCKNAIHQHINKYKKTAETFQSLGYIENIMSQSDKESDDWD